MTTYDDLDLSARSALDGMQLEHQGALDELAAAKAGAQILLDSLAGHQPCPFIGGLQTRNESPVTASYPPNVEVSWRALQPVMGAFDHKPIDDLLAAGRPFSMRPMLGRFAPPWVLEGAGSFLYTEPQGGVQVPMLRWWTPFARLATADLYRRIAQEYDGEVPYIWGSGAMTFYAEPMQRGWASDATRKAALGAGYDVTQDILSLSEGIDVLGLFKRTRVGMAFNPFQRIRPDGSGFDLDPDTTALLMDRIRAVAPTASLGNCSLRSSYLAKMDTSNGGVYRQMLERGGALRFQTAQASLVGDLAAVLQWASTVAYAVELPRGWETMISLEVAAAADMALRGHATLFPT